VNHHLAAGTSAMAILLLGSVADAAVPPSARALIERLLGVSGTYIAEEGVYKVVIPREEATVVTDEQQLSPNLGLNSWTAFTAGIHHEALLTGQFLLREGEANPVLGKVLDAGLQVTGLAASSVFDGPHLQTLDVSGVGTFSNLASAFRQGLDEIRRLHTTKAPVRSALPAVPPISAIEAGPLDAVLSLRGVVTGDVYKGAIGRRALVHGELLGREMGMSTWVSFAGTKEHAVAQGEFIVTRDELQNVLQALRAKDIRIVSLRNHTVGEQPPCPFVRFWAERNALHLAQALRYVLDVQVHAVSTKAGEKI
jgi:Domain of Unknown Function (DUF1259)